jgi:hypothetical protein
MGFLSEYDGTEKVDLGNGYWAELRVFLPSEAEAKAQQRLARVQVKADPASGKAMDMTTDVDQGAYLNEMAAQALISWNLTDKDDKLLPFKSIEDKRKSIGRLPKSIVDLFVSKIKDKPGERDADFPGEDSGSAEAESVGSGDSE